MTEREKELQAELTTPQVPEGWKPIDTAPKDGKYYLFYRKSEIQSAKWLSIGTWGDDGWCYELPSNIKNGVTKNLPTHWMPLPAAPKEK